MALLFKATGGSVAILPTTSWSAPANLFPTTDRNDSSAYSFAASTSTVTLPSSGLADGYRFTALFEFTDTSNGRHNPAARFIQTLGTGNFVSLTCSGYNRDNSEDVSGVLVEAVVDNPSALAAFQMQWSRDSDTPTGGTTLSALTVEPLYYSNIGIYSSSTSALYGGTSPSQVNMGTTIYESDTAAIERTGNVATCKGDNKRYEVLGGIWGNGWPNTRTQRVVSTRIDGVEDTHARGYFYNRNANNANNGALTRSVFETVTTDRTVDIAAWRGDGIGAYQGGADVDGSGNPTAVANVLVVIEHNDSTEIIRTVDSNAVSGASTGDQIALPGPVDLAVVRTVSFNDSAAFTKTSNTEINCEKAMDISARGQIFAAYATTATQRITLHGHITLNGVEVATTGHPTYGRGNQGTIDTFGMGMVPAGVFAVAEDDKIGLSVTELVGSEGGGNNVRTIGVGLILINLDSMETSGAVTHATSGALEGQGSSVSGSSSNFTVHSTTGILTAQGSNITGTASSFTIHPSIGSLTGQGSSLSGISERATAPHATNSILQGQGTEVIGTATRTRETPTSGILTGQGSVVVGISERIAGPVTHTATATLTGSGSEITGDSTNFTIHTSIGALTGTGTALVGSAARVQGPMARTRVSSILTLGLYGPLVNDIICLGYVSDASVSHATTGVLTGQGSVIVGTTTNFTVYSSSGILTGGGADVTGNTTSYTIRQTIGSLVGQGSVLSGSAAIGIKSTGTSEQGGQSFDGLVDVGSVAITSSVTTEQGTQSFVGNIDLELSTAVTTEQGTQGFEGSVQQTLSCSLDTAQGSQTIDGILIQTLNSTITVGQGSQTFNGIGVVLDEVTSSMDTAQGRQRFTGIVAIGDTTETTEYNIIYRRRRRE